MGPSVQAFLAALMLAAAIAAALPAVAQKPVTQVDLAKRVQKARDTAATLGERLRSELAAAIKAGGPVAAIPVCQTISPDLATFVSDEFGFEVQRTALKLRNPENAPDEWEQKILLLFQSKLTAGAEAQKLEHFEVVTTAEGDKLLRYMKPIMIGETCLACHGTDLKQDVKSEIARYYPEDKAVGYKLGDLRGAFSLAQLIEE